jgi:hypothetical protein
VSGAFLLTGGISASEEGSDIGSSPYFSRWLSRGGP